jgi:hypothetical protein
MRQMSFGIHIQNRLKHALTASLGHALLVQLEINLRWEYIFICLFLLKILLFKVLTYLSDFNLRAFYWLAIMNDLSWLAYLRKLLRLPKTSSN